MVYFESQIIRPSVSASPSKCLDGHGGTFTLVSRCVAEHTHLDYFLLLLQSIIGWELVQKWSSWDGIGASAECWWHSCPCICMNVI